MGWLDELRGTLAVGLGIGRPADVPRPALVAGLAWLPLAGLAVGAVAAGAAAAAGDATPRLAGVVGVVVLEVVERGRPRRALTAALDVLGRRGERAALLARLRGRPSGAAVVAGLLALAAKAWAGASLGPWRTTALLLAPMLGRWAVVVQCHGGSPVAARGAAAALVGRARFREFGWASVLAIGGALAAADGVGLAAVLAAALATVAVRLNANHRLGGLPGRLVAATGELVETVVLAVLAVVAQLNT